MAAEGGSWHEEVEKLCEDEDLMAAVADRSIFSLDDINLDDIFLDIKDADISGFVADNPQAGLVASSNLDGSAAVGATVAADASAGVSAVLPEGLLCDDIDVTQLEWLSNFCEESYSSDGLRFVPCNAAVTFHVAGDGDGESKKMVNAAVTSDMVDQGLIFRSSSPISVLERGISLPNSYSTVTGSSYTSSSSSPTSSSSSGTGCGTKMATAAPRSPPESIIVPARSRSKRPRPPSFSVRPPIVIPPPPSSENTTLSSSTAPLSSDDYGDLGAASQENESENAESDCSNEEKMKKKKLKKKAPSSATADGGEEEEAAAMSSSLSAGGGVRKCMHCEVTKTPQWRAGPMGPKTLCNACGVRYKSGRLFPEYRPAASPTFVATVHSNSHKKVVEMRNKVGQEPPVSEPGPRPLDVAAKSCELLEYLRRREWRTAEGHGILSE